MDSPLLINLAFLGTKYSGLTTHAKNLIPRLQGLSPLLLTSQPQENASVHPVPAGLTQENGTAGNIRRLLWTQTELPRLYRQLNSSLIFSPVPEAPIYQDCRHVITVHDLIPLRFPKISPLTLYTRYFLPPLLRQALHIITVSRATASDIHTFFQVPLDKITVIPSGYDRLNFRPLNLLPLPYFLYIGRYDPHKNLSRLLEALAGIPDDYQLYLVGHFDPRFTPSLREQAEESGISGRVKFIDRVPYKELPLLLNRALALVYPSLWEGFGLPVLEALACGTPVIVSNLSSLPEVAADAAIYVDPYRVEEIGAAMRRVAESGSDRQKWRELALRRAREFSWEKTAAGVTEVLERFR